MGGGGPQGTAGGDGCKAKSRCGRAPGEQLNEPSGALGQPTGWLVRNIFKARKDQNSRIPVQNCGRRHLSPGMGQWWGSQDKGAWEAQWLTTPMKRLEPGARKLPTSLSTVFSVTNPQHFPKAKRVSIYQRWWLTRLAIQQQGEEEKKKMEGDPNGLCIKTSSRGCFSNYICQPRWDSFKQGKMK